MGWGLMGPTSLEGDIAGAELAQCLGEHQVSRDEGLPGPREELIAWEMLCLALGLPWKTRFRGQWWPGQLEEMKLLPQALVQVPGDPAWLRTTPSAPLSSAVGRTSRHC